MKKFYVSLVGPLCGYYLPVKAESKEVVREWAADKLGKKMFCSVYDPEYLEKTDHFDAKTAVIGRTVTLTVEDGTIYENY